MYTRDSTAYVINVEYDSASCNVDGTNVQMTITITFKAGLPLVIETELNDAIARNFGNLNTTRDYTLSFQGVLSIIVINKMHRKSNIDNTANMISEVVLWWRED